MAAMISAERNLGALPARLWPVAGWRALATPLFGTKPYRLTLQRRPASSIRHICSESWPEDRAIGDGILDGALPFFGTVLPLGRAPWTAVPTGPRAASTLHGFAWLGDLAALGTSVAAERARELVAGWIACDRACTEPAWRADVLGRRLAAWLAASEFLFAGSEDGFRQRFLESTSMQARHLARVAPSVAGDVGGFAAAKGWIASALCLGVSNLNRALGFLEGEIDIQVLPDGGHAGRNPLGHAEVLRDLLDIRAALEAGGAEIPPSVQGAIDRMAPMLRAMRHGDGGLALFHDGFEGDRRVVDAVLARAAVRGKAPGAAPHTGFQRLAAGRTAVIVDTGPSLALGGAGAHASALALEVSDGRDRMIVNCGASGGDDLDWRNALRATAAHSTVTVDDVNSADLGREGSFRRHAAQVSAERREADGVIWLDTAHDGYKRRFGLVHQRRLYIDASGGDIRGEDVLDGAGGQMFRARFHLHPDVKVSLIQDGTAALLRLPSGTGWRFIAVGGALSIEESVYLGGGGRPRRAEQIVVGGPLNGAGAHLKWAIRREGERR